MAVEDLSLGRLLRRHRASADLSQEELAERAGISARTVSDVERGIRGAVYPDTAERLAEALRLEGEERAAFESAARGRRRKLPPDGSAGAASLTPTGISVQPTALIGRERELEAILAALRSQDVRLITLSGPGGIGKTRLALEAAEISQTEFEDGAFLVSLAANRDPALVVPIIAHAVGLRHAGEPLKDALMEHLRGRRALLVLDTFEQVLDAAPLIGELIASCPRITVLVTSRAALRLRGEQEFPLSPLELPDDTHDLRPDDLLRSSAVALFMERAVAVKPDFQLDEDTAPIVTEICRRVDGLPLALELAAARLKHLPLRALRDQMDHRLRVLTGGPRDVPPRQQAMRDTVAWSYDLLEPVEQELFRQLSVFAGGWTLEASESVCTPGDARPDVLEGTSALVDRSLVFLADGPGETPRYGMLDVIHEYAAEQRDLGGGIEELARRHAEYFLRLAEQAEPELGGADQDLWFRRLDADHENLRTALRWSLDRGDAEVALRLSGALWQFWRHRGDVTEGRSWLETALGLDPDAGRRERGKALWGAAWLAYHQGDLQRAESLGQELHSLALAEGDRLGVRNGLTILGKVAAARGLHVESIAPFEEALSICRELGKSWHLATSEFNLGLATLQGGDDARAETLFEEALALYRELGDAHFSARVLRYVAYPALLRADTEASEFHLAESLALSRELNDTWGITESLEGLSAVYAARGESDRAARMAGAAQALRGTIAMQQMPEDRELIERYLVDARAELGEPAWNDAVARGRSTPLDDAVDEALGATGRTRGADRST